MCSEPEIKEDVEGWIPGKVRYCYGCTRKLKFKRKCEEGARDNKDESSNTELEASKKWEFFDVKRFTRANLCMFFPSAIFNFGAKPKVRLVPRPLALGFQFGSSQVWISRRPKVALNSNFIKLGSARERSCVWINTVLSASF